MKDLEESIGRRVNSQSEMNHDLGSLLEAWTTRDSPGCAFCNAPSPDYTSEDTGGREFCDEDCKEGFEKVIEARLALGRRDLEQRGYD